MVLSDEKRALLWLSAAEIPADRVQRLVDEYGSARALWNTYDGRLSSNRITQEMLGRFHSEMAIDALIARADKLGVSLLFRDDPTYPTMLECIDDPPYALYCMGEMTQTPCVGIVGTRLPSGYGRDVARSIAFGLAKAGICVTSGLARGIDGCAHEGALDADGRTIAVLGSGVNVPYPLENASLYRTIIERSGAVVSEYPLDAQPQAYHFPQRNRIISGLSHAVIFVEGKIKSGGMLTVETALRQGREVFAVPGRVGQSLSEGPHTIIREGARLVTSAANVLEDLNLLPHDDLTVEQPSKVCEETATQPQRVILNALRKEDMGIDALSEATGLTADVLMSELSVLEIMGQIRKESGNIFALCIRTNG